MSDNTSKMISLLGKMRKQMNGAVADSMFYYGKDYGLNYGVSLPTIRSIAKEEEHDYDFALYLLRQQVRELKLAAMHIAQPSLLTLDNSKEWADAIINSEIAEECAFALLRHTPHINEIFHNWISSENMFAAYAALMAMARCQITRQELAALPNIVALYPNERPIAQGIVALLDAAYQNPALSHEVEEVLQCFVPSACTEYIADEMSWRMYKES